MGVLALGLLFALIYITKRYKDAEDEILDKHMELEDVQGFLQEEMFLNKVLTQKIQSLDEKLMKDLLAKLEAEIDLEHYMSQHMAELLGETYE
jgi:hypothetical protein